MASPLNQLLALAALVVCWKSGNPVRLYLGAALLVAVLTDALTFGYFYPRNDIMFRTASLTDSPRGGISTFVDMCLPFGSRDGRAKDFVSDRPSDASTAIHRWYATDNVRGRTRLALA